MKLKIYILLLLFLCLNISFADEPNDEAEVIKLYNKSYALIVGVSEYNNGWPKLYGVKKDVAAVQQALEKHGFTVETVMDPDDIELDRAYKDFINKYGLDPENRLILYFAGHGHTVHSTYGEEMGYIVPKNAPNPNTDMPNFLGTALAMQQIEVYAKQIQSKHALFLFDACFAGSIFSLSRSAPANISYKTAKPVRQFITSGSADETVPDQSIFRMQFIYALEGDADFNGDTYITGSELGEFLQEKVINYSNGTQHPQHGKIRNPNLDKGDFVFKVGGGELNSLTTGLADDNAEAPRGIVGRGLVDEAAKALIDYANLTFSFEEEFGEMPEIFSKVAIKTSSGNYLSADNGGGRGVNAKPDHIEKFEIFEIIPLGGYKAAFKTHKGFYLSAEKNKINAKAGEIGEKGTFEIVILDGNIIGIRTCVGTFLSAAEGGGGKIDASKKRLKPWERFELKKMRRLTLKSVNDNFIHAVNGGGGGVQLDVNKVGKHEVMVLVKVGKNKVAVQTASGYYLTLEGNEITAKSKEINSESVFELNFEGDSYISLKAPNGNYLTAVGGGGFSIRADAKTVGDWQKFRIDVIIE